MKPTQLYELKEQMWGIAQDYLDITHEINVKWKIMEALRNEYNQNSFIRTLLYKHLKEDLI